MYELHAEKDSQKKKGLIQHRDDMPVTTKIGEHLNFSLVCKQVMPSYDLHF